jgi:hypothetical protein
MLAVFEQSPLTVAPVNVVVHWMKSRLPSRKKAERVSTPVSPIATISPVPSIPLSQSRGVFEMADSYDHPPEEK